MTARPDSDKYFYVSKYVFMLKNLDERKKEKLTTLWSGHKFSTFLCFFMVPDDLKKFFLSTSYYYKIYPGCVSPLDQLFIGL